MKYKDQLLEGSRKCSLHVDFEKELKNGVSEKYTVSYLLCESLQTVVEIVMMVEGSSNSNRKFNIFLCGRYRGKLPDSKGTLER